MDVLVFTCVLTLGALQFLLPIKGDEFFRGDTIYIELARSMLDSGRYGVDFNDVQYPPGLPALLAVLCASLGCAHEILVRSMPVFLALALIVSYWLLKHEEGTAVAAVTCLLIASSPLVFEFSTQWVYSDLPYFLTTMATLMVAAHVSAATNEYNRALLRLLCAVSVAASLLMRSSAVALTLGLAGWLVIGGGRIDQGTRARRWRDFSGILLVAVFVPAVWMTWVGMHETVEWPSLEGHPRTYLSQLKVKSGIHPELGVATVTDVLARVPRNVTDRAAGLMQLLTRRAYIDSAWYSPLVLGTVVLIAVGLGASLWVKGGSLAEWYFISYEAMYLVWPWPYEERFLLPVAPLACLYLWRGGKSVGHLAARAPRALGVAGVLAGVSAGTAASVASWRSESLQSGLAAIFWVMFVVASVSVASPLWPRIAHLLARHSSRRRFALTIGDARLSVMQLFGALVVVTLTVVGVVLQIDVGRRNTSFDLAKSPSYERIVAARWIAEHTPSTAVVMARQMDVVHHYANRKVVWFPPISDARTLVDGIRRLGVDYIVVTNIWTYYMPTEDDCIATLLREYPQAFDVVHQGSRFRIVRVVRDKLPTDGM